MQLYKPIMKSSAGANYPEYVLSMIDLVRNSCSSEAEPFIYQLVNWVYRNAYSDGFTDASKYLKEEIYD